MSVKFDFARLALVSGLSLAGGLTVFAEQANAAPYSDYASTQGETAIAGVLDQIATPSATPYGPLLQSIDDLPDAASQADALGQLTPRAYKLLPRLAIQSMDSADRQVRDYLAERRDRMLDAPAGSVPTGEESITFMLTGGLKQGNYKARADRPSANSDSRSIRAGIDVTAMDGLILGATIGIDGIDANLDRAQHPRITQFNASVGPYASYTNGKIYADATAAYSLSQYKLRRQVAWSGFSDQLRAGVEGDNASATVEVGGILQTGVLRAQPFVGLQYRYADVSGFIEYGGDAALAVAGYKTESVRSSLGLRTSAGLERGSWNIRPTVRAEWQRELNPRPDSRVEAAFANGDLPIFTLKSSRMARDAAIVGAGLSAVYNDRTAIRIGYDGEFASDRHIHAFTLTASRRF